MLRGALLLAAVRGASGNCEAHNHCNGHGTCITSTQTCACFEGWGADADTTDFRSQDCSTRVCPKGRAWGDVPTAHNMAHAMAECSARGRCNRKTGTCECFRGFEGNACNRRPCPNGCSGHGRCLSVREMAYTTDAQPSSPPTTYGGDGDTTEWDMDMIFGCVCDSNWPVGLGAGEVQEPEWFGADCSLRHCPSGDDPYTAADETDCAGRRPPALPSAASAVAGAAGNKCHVDCANRGVCDYRTGTCACFRGTYGYNCATKAEI